jgi:Family of unknown function (DUF5906)/Bifunctional DNA primase/polymerase, N-terminal
MNTPDIARTYIAAGFHVVPLAPRSKAPRSSDWTHRTFTPEDFAPNDNIGFQPCDGLVDIDLDTEEALAVADTFLPKTPLAFGRPSHPLSHRIYRSSLTAHKKFIDDVAPNDARKATLFEIRVGTQFQTMLPPSIHPDGEQLTWANGHDPATALAVDADPLLRTAKLVATAAMVARYYNPPKDRHDWCMSLAGTLRHLGLTVLEVEHIIEAAARVADDANLEHRRQEITSTFAKPDNTPLKAETDLLKAIPDKEVAKRFLDFLKDLWGGRGGTINPSLVQRVVEELNQKYAVIHDQGGNLWLLVEEPGEEPRLSPLRDIFSLEPFKVPIGTSARGAPILRAKADMWFESPHRRAFRGMETQPNPRRARRGWYNQWQGWAVEPKRGDWSLFREHISMLVNHDERWARYVLSWMANCVQRPDEPSGIALVFKGPQGTGKSTFGTWFGALFGRHFLHLDSEQRLTGRFNAHLHNVIVVLADEAVWAQRRVGQGMLKRMITEQTLHIEYKHRNPLVVPNMLHMIVASNEDWAAPVGIDDRRFAVWLVPKEHQNDYAFFRQVHTQLFEEGGLAALLYDLLAWTDHVDLKDIPDTEERTEQKTQSMSAHAKWWLDVLMDGTYWTHAHRNVRGHKHEETGLFQVERGFLYEQMCLFFRGAFRYEEAGSQTRLGQFLASVVPEGFVNGWQDKKSGGKWYYLFPALTACRAFFDSMYGTRKWPKEEESEEEVNVKGKFDM